MRHALSARKNGASDDPAGMLERLAYDARGFGDEGRLRGADEMIVMPIVHRRHAERSKPPASPRLLTLARRLALKLSSKPPVLP